MAFPFCFFLSFPPSEENKSPSERRFGIAVLAIDRLLVKTLGASMEGLEGESKRILVAVQFESARRPWS